MGDLGHGLGKREIDSVLRATVRRQNEKRSKSISEPKKNLPRFFYLDSDPVSRTWHQASDLLCHWSPGISPSLQPCQRGWKNLTPCQTVTQRPWRQQDVIANIKMRYKRTLEKMLFCCSSRCHTSSVKPGQEHKWCTYCILGKAHLYMCMCSHVQIDEGIISSIEYIPF